MVGSVLKVPLCEITRKWLDVPYGETTCIGFVHDFLEEATGKQVPDSFGELTIENHFEKWRADKAGTEQALCEAVVAYTQPADPNYPRLLDLLVVRIKDGGLTPAVYVGGGNAIACFIKVGVTVFNLDENNQAILAGSI